MGYFEASEGSSIRLTFNNILGDGTITVSANVYSGTTLVDTVALSHVASGFYSASYTIPTGYSQLDIFYIPSGSDNANAIDNVKIRTLSSVSGGGGVMGGADGLNDDDIAAIQKMIEKVIDNKISTNVWSQRLASGRTAEQELLAKSEYDVRKDTVKTNEISLDKIRDLIQAQIGLIRSDIESRAEVNKARYASTITEIKRQVETLKADGLLDRLNDIASLVNKIAPLVSDRSIVSLLDSLQSKIDSLSEVIPRKNSEVVAQLIEREANKVTREIKTQLKETAKGSDTASITRSANEIVSMLKRSESLMYDVDSMSKERLEKLLSMIGKMFDQVLNEIRTSRDSKSVEKGFRAISRALLFKDEI